MDAASLVLVLVGLLALVGAAASSLGTDSRDGFGHDRYRPDQLPRDIAPRIR